jgi:hypothetical protein
MGNADRRASSGPGCAVMAHGLPRPGHPPTSPMMHEPISGAIATAALFFGASATTAAAIGGAVVSAVIGVAVSELISIRERE